MNAKGHIAVGLTAYTTVMGVTLFVDPSASISALSFGLGLGAVTVGSVLPDIDTPRSTIGRMVKPVSRWLSSHYPHRTVTHNALFILAWFIFAKVIGLHVLWALAWGIFGHIFIDSFSWQGVLWTYPLKQWSHYRSGGQYKKGRPYHKGYKVGGPFEKVVYHWCWIYLSVLMLVTPWIVVALR